MTARRRRRRRNINFNYYYYIIFTYSILFFLISTNEQLRLPQRASIGARS